MTENEEVFYSLDDILKEQELPREAIFEYRGKRFKLAWASITDDEMPQSIELNRMVDKLVPKKFVGGKEVNKEERKECFNRLFMDEIVFRRIKKGQELLDKVYITKEQYDKLDATVKSYIKTSVLEADMEDGENLDGGQDSL